MEDVLLQQAFGGASFQHVRDDDGGLAALKVRVVPTSRYGYTKAEPWCLHAETTQITETRRTIITCFSKKTKYLVSPLHKSGCTDPV